VSIRPLRVVKVGGSLLTLDNLGHKLRTWLDLQSPAVNVLLAGGGTAANLVREADRQFCLEEERTHWLAVQAMSLTANLLHALLPEADMVGSLSVIRAVAGTPWLIVDPEKLLRLETEKLGAERIPHNWHVTSDSIAARIAEVVDADELVLLKSRELSRSGSWRQAADEGFVDRYFPVAAAELRQVRVVNLRNATISPAAASAR